jgi:hypothetical protein
MSNETKQTAVEELIEEIMRRVSIIQSEPKSMVREMMIANLANDLDLFKEMEKEQINNAIKNELKLIGNYFDVSKLEQREQGHHIRFTSILKDRFDFYNETYGGNK